MCHCVNINLHQPFQKGQIHPTIENHSYLIDSIFLGRILSVGLHQEIHALYETHHGWLVGWLKRRTGCTFHANDLAQDTFVRVIDKSIHVSGILEPKAFLSTIAKGLMIDQVRRRELEQAYLEAIAHLPEAIVNSPENQMVVIESLMRIDALFDGLNDQVRKAFLLSRLEGYTYPEIAAILNVSLRSVEAYMAQAIRHFLAHA